MHLLGTVLAGLRDAGLRLEGLQERPRVAWQMFRCLMRDGDVLWAWPDRPWLPLSLGLLAAREG